MVDSQHSVDVFEVYILAAASNFYKPTYTSKLFSFVCCSNIVSSYFLRGFRQAI